MSPVNEFIDGHIHLFDHAGHIDMGLIKPSKKCVCFADIAFRYWDMYKQGEIIGYYDDFIKNHFDPTKHILLATGITSNEMISIYKKYPQFIKGFGELKCYSKWKGGRLPYGDLKWIRPLLEFNKGPKLPVYIHFNLDTQPNRKKFEELVADYGMFPIVLCHAGMVEGKDNDLIHGFIRDLLSRYSNLYIDISTNKTREFYIQNPGKMLELGHRNIIIGTDINPIIKDVIKNPIQFTRACYSQVKKLNTYGNFTSAINTIFKLQDDKATRLINLYRNKFDKFDRHCKVHLLTRGNLVGMFAPYKIRQELEQNVAALNEVLDLFDTDKDTLLNKYVLIGYSSDKRKKEIGKLFKSVDEKYKTFLCLITILEMTYTFQRLELLDMIDTKRISKLISTHIDLIRDCIRNDEYDFKSKASTKYVNSIFFVRNLGATFKKLNAIMTDRMMEGMVEYFVDLYNKTPNTTTIYGITHILIGASDFYTKQIDGVYKKLAAIVDKCICNDEVFNSVTFDLQMELLLCSKLFGNHITRNMDRYIEFNNLEDNEHTNMLYILLNKYDLYDKSI